MQTQENEPDTRKAGRTFFTADTPGKKNQKPHCSAEHQYYGGHLLVIFPPLCWLQESYSPAQHLSPCALLPRHISPLKTAQEEPRQKNQRESSKKVAPGWTEPTYTLNNCALLSASNAGWRRLCSTYPSSAGHVAQALGLTRKLFCSYTSFAIRPPWQRTRAPLAGGFQAGETKHFLITVAEEGWIWTTKKIHTKTRTGVEREESHPFAVWLHTEQFVAVINSWKHQNSNRAQAQPGHYIWHHKWPIWKTQPGCFPASLTSNLKKTNKNKKKPWQVGISWLQSILQPLNGGGREGKWSFVVWFFTFF